MELTDGGVIPVKQCVRNGREASALRRQSSLVEVSEKLKQYGEENIDTSAWNAEEYTGLEYEILKDGIPVMGSEEPTQGYYLDIQQAIPAYVRVLMGDGKLIGVSIQEMFEEKSVYSTPILSSEEALGILQKEDEEIISDKTGEIEEIKLEYVMIPDWTTEIWSAVRTSS